MKVIINADDFGYNAAINASIENAIKLRRISSTSIMANGNNYEEAIDIAKKYDNISYGIHLNITEFAPLTSTEVFRKYNLIDDNGCFIKRAALYVPEYTEELVQAIKDEWRTQIKKVIKSGVKISHIDSHQHTHTIWELQDIVIELMDEFEIERVRRKFYTTILESIRIRKYKSPKYSTPSFKSKASGNNLIYKLTYSFFILPFKYKKWIKKMKKHAKLTDSFSTYQIFVQDLPFQKHRLKNKMVELECHPGLEPNIEETQWLMNDELGKILSDYKLINYWEL